MGYFENLKFGGGSIGLFDNSNLQVGALLGLVEGQFRTEGTFAPASIGFSETNKGLGLDSFIGKKSTPSSPVKGWSPVVRLKPLKVTRQDGNVDASKGGFLPPSYLSSQIVDKKIGKGKINEYNWNEDNAWIGHLLNQHIESEYYNGINWCPTDTIERFEEAPRGKIETEGYSTRDHYIRFNDQATDYFKHGLHIDGYTNLKTGRNERESWDGSGDSFRLASFKNTPYENNDPVSYGFEIVIDAVSSPLLNGAAEDFISQFSYISEIASRAVVMDDFKRQFSKIFKTKGTIKNRESYQAEDTLINAQREGQYMASNTKGILSNYATTDTQTNLYRPGKKAYMGYYLQKVTGLSKLVESNSSIEKKYLADYNKDTITLSFLEDVSSTMGTLAHLYKLLYWSKPNGKGLIPENLLRFNCDIIVSECRNFNRVRKATKTGDLEVIKDNVSRYIYSLKECQFYFNAMPHEDVIDMGNIKTYGEGGAGFDVTFDYKYSSSKFEKWIPDADNFGQYVGYNNGAIWKIGNKGMRSSEAKEGRWVVTDNSVPKFYTVGTNTLRANGVTKAIILDAFKVSPESDGEEATLPEGTTTGEFSVTNPTNTQKPGDSIGEDEESKDSKKEERKKKRKSSFDQFKKNAKNTAINLAKGAAKFVFSEINNQINVRAKLLEDTINKTRNLLGEGGLKDGKKNVYPRPYTPHSFGIYFDVRNELFNFVGNEIAGIIGGAAKSVLPGTQLNFPFKMPNAGAILNDIVKNNSRIPGRESVFGRYLSVPFGRPANTQSVNLLFNSNTTFKNITMSQVKFGGGLGVTGLSYMKPKGKIYSDGNTKNATMLDFYSNPLNNKGPIGTKDYSKIQFPANGQKYPAPITPIAKTLGKVLAEKTVWNYAMGSVQFPTSAQKYPAPLSQGIDSLERIVKSGTKWSFPVNNKKFGL